MAKKEKLNVKKLSTRNLNLVLNLESDQITKKQKNEAYVELDKRNKKLLKEILNS